MSGATVLERLVQRDRLIAIGALAAIAGIAWLYAALLAQAMARGDMTLVGMGTMDPSMMTGTMGIEMLQTMPPWTLATAVLLLVMWWAMMIAMMVPSAAPTVLLYARIYRGNHPALSPGVAIAAFVAGYLAVWGFFSAEAVVLQWLLTKLRLLSPAMESGSRIFAAVLLVGAALYEVTPLKQACLAHCRSPVGFLSAHWRDGRYGAFRMGVTHGLYCLGCCWALMLLLFVAGMMNLFWVAALALFVLLQKLLPGGTYIAKIGAVAMIGLAIYLLIAGPVS